MHLELNIMERLATARIFSEFKVRTIAKIEQRQSMLDSLEITDEEKKDIGWEDIEGGRAKFKNEIASKLIIKVELTKWQTDVLTATLIYSELLDDFSPAFCRIHHALVGKK